MIIFSEKMKSHEDCSDVCRRCIVQIIFLPKDEKKICLTDLDVMDQTVQELFSPDEE